MDKQQNKTGWSRLAGSLLAAAIALPAQAGISASAIVELTNFSISGGGFAFLASQPVTTANVAADMSGLPSSSASLTVAGDLNLAPACTGPAGNCPQLTDNAFPLITGAPTATFSSSDQVHSGLLTANGRLAVAAYAGVKDGIYFGSADSNDNVQGNFTVTGGVVTLQFDARAYHEAFVGAGEASPGFSTGSHQVTFSIRNRSTGATVFTWNPDGQAGGIFGGAEVSDPFSLSSSVSLNAPAGGMAADATNAGIHAPGAASTGNFVATADLPSGNYALSVRINAHADASRQRVLSALGDRVWKDTNGNGLQDCTDTNGNGILGDAGDTGAECGNGVANVRVSLTYCDGTAVPGVVDQFTDANGFYLFTGLDPAQQYKVTFDKTTTGGLVFTTKGPDGSSDAADSDADPTTGETECITLTPGATDRTWDAGLVEPFVPAKLGDRVWEDKNGNGVQDCADTNGNGILGDVGDTGAECGNGVPNVTVRLTNCAGTVLDTTTTDASGFYLFNNLAAGQYCVEFVKPTNFCAGVAFTNQDAGSDNAADSDANPADGTTAPVTLAPGETNRTVDAGVLCPAKLGDRVWLDNNSNGNQDCTGTIDPANPGQVIPNGGVTCTEPPVANVSVRLTDCSGGVASDINGNTVPAQTTDANGRYLFTNLRPGVQYCVEFTRPAGYNCTTPNASGVGYQVNSDGVTNGGLCTTAGVTLPSGGDDRSWDLGLIPPAPNCDLRVNKTCEIATPPNNNWVCKKPLDVLTMKSDFTEPVKIKAYKSTVGSQLLATIDNILPGQVVSVGGYAAGTYSNDVYWEVFKAGTNTKLGVSTFHISCSDVDMNGPEDCGKLQGDGKTACSSSSCYLNKWRLEGLDGPLSGKLACTVTPTFPSAEACTATLKSPPSCLTMGKPKTLVFEYTGAGCSATTNTQGGKATCSSSGTLNDPVDVKGGTSLGSSVYTVSPSSVSVGETFTVSYGTTTLGSNSYFELKDAQGDKQLLTIHTSCSQPLAVGDQFGALKLVGFNGATGGTDVNYGYTITNLGDPVTVTSILDNKLGPVGMTPFPLGTNGTAQFTKLATLTGTTTNTVTVTANTATGGQCTATDSLTVTFAPPPPAEWTTCKGKLKKFSLIWPSNEAPITISGITNDATGGVVNPGQRVTFSGPWSTNDLYLNITDKATGKSLGKSTFHVSCSDPDMDGLTSTNLSQQQLPGKKQDCGKFQGNGKTTTSTYINKWLLDGMVDAIDQVLNCSPTP